jgi:hypothetical protein
LLHDSLTFFACLLLRPSSRAKMIAKAACFALVAAATATDTVTNLTCAPGTGDAVAVPDKLAPMAFEQLAYGAVAPSGWLLDQLVTQANALSGWMPISQVRRPGGAVPSKWWRRGGSPRDTPNLDMQPFKRPPRCSHLPCRHPVSQFPGAIDVNTSLWIGGDGKAGGGTDQVWSFTMLLSAYHAHCHPH